MGCDSYPGRGSGVMSGTDSDLKVFEVRQEMGPNGRAAAHAARFSKRRSRQTSTVAFSHIDAPGTDAFTPTLLAYFMNGLSTVNS